MVRSLSIVTDCGRFHSPLAIHPVSLLPGRRRRMSSGSDAFPRLPAGSFVFMKDRSPSGSHRASGKSAADKTGSDRGNPRLGIGFLYRELWRFADGRRSTLMWAVLLLIGSQGFKLAVPALAGTALNTLQAQGLAGLSQAAQMVALARTIALDPELVLYDEPFTGLDPISLGVIAHLISRVNRSLRSTSVMVTHDIEKSLQIVDQVIFLAHGEIVFSGTPDEMRELDSPWVRQFVGGLPNGPVAFRYPAAQDLRQDLLAPRKGRAA